MRIAALYDIHANAIALEAVLADVAREGADLIVIGGDVAWGPQPVETLDLLAGLADVAFLRGNADREVGEGLGVAEGLAPEVAEVAGWCADRLGHDRCRHLAELPETLSFDIEGLGPTLFCHGSPRSDEEPLTPLTSESRLASALAGTAEATVVCGHTHIQFERRSGSKTVVNAGSVGLPYQRPLAAYWALIGPGIRLRATPYDVGAAVEAMRTSGCPHAEGFFVETLLAPPTADEAARRFDPDAR